MRSSRLLPLQIDVTFIITVFFIVMFITFLEFCSVFESGLPDGELLAADACPSWAEVGRECESLVPDDDSDSL